MNKILFRIPCPFSSGSCWPSILHLMLNNMRYGRYLCAVGIDRRAAKVASINVNRMLLPQLRHHRVSGGRFGHSSGLPL